LISEGRLRSVRLGGSRRIPAAALVAFVATLDDADAFPGP
jgi:excisionase family DNA binding protein